MGNEQKVFGLILSEHPWEQVLYQIVSYEGLDPWDIDITKLAESFISHISKMEDTDFNVPAKFIIISAIILRMKSEFLDWQEEEEVQDLVEAENYDREMRMFSERVPPLSSIVSRSPKRKVTLQELVLSLRKAMVTYEKKEDRRRRYDRNLENFVDDDAEDINETIEKLYEKIRAIDSEKKGDIKFGSLPEKWEREIVIKTFLSMLHLSDEKRIECDQPEMFKEIFIRLLEEQGVKA